MDIPQDEPGKLAENLLQAADAKGRLAWRIFVTILFVLGMLWIGQLEPLVPLLKRFVNAKQSSLQSRDAFVEARRGFADSNSPISADERRKLRRLTKEVTESDDRRKAEAAALAVPFDFPGLPSVNVPKKFAGLAWCAVLFSLLVYLSTTRAEILASTARAIRMLEGGRRSLSRPAVVYTFPWWAVPLPASDGNAVSAYTFRAFVGVSNRERAYKVGVAALLGSVLTIQIRVAVITVAALSTFGDLSRFSGESIFLVGVTACIVLLSASMALLWFWRDAVPDAFADELPPLNLSRRHVIFGVLGLGVAGVSAAIAVMRGPRFLVRWMHKPRYRRRAPIASTHLASGLYTIGSRNKAVQYVQKVDALNRVGFPRDAVVEKPVLGVRRTAYPSFKESEFHLVALLKDGEVDGAVIARLDRNHHGAIVEKLAREFWRKGDRSLACEVLRYGVARDLHDLNRWSRGEPNWRIYYLLAQYSLRASDPSLSWMLATIAGSERKNEFAAAIRSWTDTKLRWRKRLRYLN